MTASIKLNPAPEEANEALSVDIITHASPDLEHGPQSHDFADAGLPNLQIPSQESSRRLKQAARRVLKPLIALATSQYVIVALLGGVAAWAISSETAVAVNAKLAPLITALKRF